MALVVAVGVMAILVSVCGALVGASSNIRDLVFYATLELRATFAAQAGVNYGISNLRTFAAPAGGPPDGGLAFNPAYARPWFNGSGNNSPAAVSLGVDDDKVGTQFRVGLVQNLSDARSLTFDVNNTVFYNNTDIRVYILHSEGEVVDTQNGGKVMARVTMEQRFISASVTPYRLDRL